MSTMMPDDTRSLRLEQVRPLSGAPWRMALDEAGTAAAERLSRTLGLSLPLARLLVHRKVDAQGVESYLEPRLKDLMPDPCVLRDMEKGAERIARAVQRGESVTVFGDFDVDGATSVALMVRYLAGCGLTPRYYIPDRLTEGYGPNAPALEKIREEGTTLCIMLDCGTVAMEPLTRAAEVGLDVVVIDHHQAGESLPPANAIINPNREDDLSGLGYLCAAGVTFLTLVALGRILRQREFFSGRAEPDLLAMADLVALGTVCDVVPLTGLNRAFVRLGLKVIEAGRNPGLTALRRVARADGPPNPYHLGFLLGPRINAGGRIGDTEMGARLLITHDADRVDLLARELDTLNAQRQALERDMLEEALAAFPIGCELDSPFVLAHGEGWHPGIVGLVASRLKERFGRPALAIAFDGEGKGSGSARSIPGVDLGRIIRGAVDRGLLEKGGGHAMAAGFRLDRAGLEPFRQYLEAALLAPVEAAGDGLAHLIEGEISAGAVNDAFLREIERVGPFGAGNAEPLFLLPAHRLSGVKRVGESHVSFFAADSQNRSIKGISFRCADRPLGRFLLERMGGRAHLLGTLKWNHWQGRSYASLHLLDAAEAP